MANTLFTTIRHSLVPAFKNITKTYPYVLPIISSQNVRTLYNKSTLGLDGFLQQQERTKYAMANIADKFREKMNEYSGGDSKNMIFTEDLKNMIHLAESDEDIELVVKMIKRFNQQNKQLRFGNYIFGPVVMRLFHNLNKPDVALECFKSPEMSGFFDHLMSFQILLDLLYENQKYKEMLEVVDIITKEKQMEGMKYPRNIIVLAMAACFKLNNKESLDYALNLWNSLKDVGHLPMRRAVTFCAGLVLNQGEPGLAMEIISTARNQNYTTVRNIKVAALVDVGRVEDAIPLLKTVIAEDIPGGHLHTVNKDVLERTKNAVTKLDNPDLALDYNRLEQIFQKEGHVSSLTLDEQLCVEIQKPANMNSRSFDGNRQFQRNQRPYTGGYNNNGRRFEQRYRPGLTDLH